MGLFRFIWTASEDKKKKRAVRQHGGPPSTQRRPSTLRRLCSNKEKVKRVAEKCGPGVLINTFTLGLWS